VAEAEADLLARRSIKTSAARAASFSFGRPASRGVASGPKRRSTSAIATSASTSPATAITVWSARIAARCHATTSSRVIRLTEGPRPRPGGRSLIAVDRALELSPREREPVVLDRLDASDQLLARFLELLPVERRLEQRLRQ